jgi:hypothetical protein
VREISHDRYVRAEKGTPMRQDTRTLVRAAFATVLGVLSVPLAGSPEVRAQTPPNYNPYPSGILPANLDSEISRVRREVQTIFGRYFAEWQALILNPAVDLEAATGFAAPYNRSERLKPVRAGAAGRAGGPSGSVSGLRSGCDTTVAPGPTAPQFLATAPGSRRSAGRRGVPCVGRHACC